MSLTITIRPNGATSGGESKTLPTEGDNGNQEIDTKAEAESALALLPEGSANNVFVGDRSYTRTQLIEIRDRKPAAADSKMVQGEGGSHGFGLEFYSMADRGSVGHGGIGLRPTYRYGMPLKTGEGTRLNLDIIGGLNFEAASRSFITPGGESVDSSLRTNSIVAGADVRLTPPVLDHRLFAALGARFLVGKFGTDEGASVSLPASCKPDDFGRAECEPNAGPRTGNAGTKGLWSEHLGAARETSGLSLGIDVPLTLGVTALRGGWGSMDIFGGGMMGVRKVSPDDGNGIRYTAFGGFVGIAGRFGGADSYVRQTPATPPPAAAVIAPPPPADKDGDGVPDTDDKCPDVKGVKDNAGCPAYEASVTSSPASVKAQEKFLVGLKVGTASKVRISFKSEDGTLNNSNSILADEGNSKSEFSVPAELKSGKYKLVVTFEDMNTHVKKVEERDIVIVENVTATLPGSFAPGQPPTIQAAKVVGMEKLEGVTYVIEGFDGDKKSIGTLDSTTIAKGERNWALDEKKGTRIPLGAPGGKGFKKDINYVVTLRNKEGLPVWTGSFEVGQAAVFNRKVKPK